MRDLCGATSLLKLNLRDTCCGADGAVHCTTYVCAYISSRESVAVIVLFGATEMGARPLVIDSA